MSKKKLIFLLLSLGTLFLVSSSYAGTIAESTFSLNDEGWLVTHLFSTPSTKIPTYVNAGGNPDGFIRTGDIFSWNAYLAPAKFLGNQSAAYGGSLSFDLRVVSSDGNNYYAAVLEGNGLQVGFRSGVPTTAWTSFTIPLLASSGWLKKLDGGGLGGDPITEAELIGVLSNLTALRIDADWYTGGDQVDLDNVRLNSSPIPLPPSVWLFGSALVSLVGWRRFSKS